MLELIIRNGAIGGESGVFTGDVAIADGQIVAVGNEVTGNGQTEIDATGLHLFPGVIDAHVHFNEPGRAGWEGFVTGTQALAAGGATVCFDMPLNAHPPTLDGASFEHKRVALEGVSWTDIAVWGGLVPGNLDRMEELAACGVVGFKAFMSNSGIDDFPAADDLTLYEGMMRAAELGLIVAVHAESEALTGRLAARAIAAGKTTARDYLRSRPAIAEIEAIGRALLLAEETGCALHIVHVSTGRGVALVAAARARGVDVSCETCPHYLVLTEDDLETLGAVAKCAPPLRAAAVRDALWSGLLDGDLSMVASDHSPAPPDLKSGDDFFRVWGGISGCQSLLPLLLTDGYHRRHLPLPVIADITAGYVARRFRLPEKGRLAPGADADVTLVDLDAGFTLNRDDLFYRHKHSPYVGRRFRGRVVRTILRGVTTLLDGKIVSPPVGRLIRPVSSPL